MRFAVSAGLLASVSLVAAETYEVMVSNESNAFQFFPDTLSDVQTGDTVQFLFVAGNHTVTQSTFADPCSIMEGGLDSGYLPANAAESGNVPSWSFDVEDASAPLWFYCRQGQHCASGGMVFSLNPTADKTHEQFKAIAMGAEAPSDTDSESDSEDSDESSSDDTNSALTNSGSVGAALLAGIGLLAGLL